MIHSPEIRPRRHFFNTFNWAIGTAMALWASPGYAQLEREADPNVNDAAGWGTSLPDPPQPNQPPGPGYHARVLVLRAAACPTGIEPDALRSAIAQELGVEVVLESSGDGPTPDRIGTLDVDWGSPGTARVSFRSSDSSEPLHRTLALPSDVAQSLEQVALLAGNLARDEAGELIDALRAARAARQAEEARALTEQSKRQAPVSLLARPRPARVQAIAPKAATPGKRGKAPPSATELHRRIMDALGKEQLAFTPATTLKTEPFELTLAPPVALHQRAAETRFNLALALGYHHLGGVAGVGASLGASRVEGPVHGFAGALFWNQTRGQSLGALGSAIGNYAIGPLQGADLAGVFNIRWGSVQGKQISGVFNRAQSLEGAQVAAVNWVGGDLLGMQFGAVNRVYGDGLGAQASALVNVTQGHWTGFQFAGLVNVTRGRVRGGQLAGLVNAAGPGMTGFQFAGLVNTAGAGPTHTQIASLVNTAGDVDGVQVGLVNVAGRVRGTQLGLINVAREMKGVPIGLINLARNGRIQLSAWHDRGIEGNLGIKLRSGLFYTQFGWGADPVNRVHTFSAGGGFHFGGRLYAEVDNIFRAEWDLTAANQRDARAFHLRAKVGYEAIPGMFSVFAGAGLRTAYPVDFSTYKQEPLWILGFEVF